VAVAVGPVGFQTKDGYTDYAYGTAGTKPHAVTAARGNFYSYDANGNLTGGAGRVITWNSANLPTRITKGSAVTDFSYGPDRARYKQVSTVSGVTTTTFYVGKLYEQSTVGTQNTYKNYIHAGGRVVAIRETINSGTAVTKYLHQDHLGSTDVITSSTGQVLERQSFDAFGTRRVASTWNPSATPITSPYSTRGYTGHEQVDPVGLIHMNGRVYDPDLGRFISADPTVQAPGNGQSLNRYSYVWNNPLAYTDPSGYRRFLPGLTNRLDDHVWKPIGNAIGVNGEDFRKYGLPVLAIVTAPWAGLYAGTTFGWSTTAGYAFSGFTGGFIASGGDFEAGAYGALTGGIMAGASSLGEAWFGQNSFGAMLTRSAAGGINSRIMGGDFRDGFGMTLGIEGANWAGWKMREKVLDWAKNNPLYNDSLGSSAGVWSDGNRTAGILPVGWGYSRRGTLARFFETFNFGGRQLSDSRYIFGVPYSKGGLVDTALELFGGPHDFLDYPLYDTAQGMNRDLGLLSPLGLAYSITTLPVPAPFAASMAIQPVQAELWAIKSGL
jgi:RHS repeat-associated protein